MQASKRLIVSSYRTSRCLHRLSRQQRVLQSSRCCVLTSQSYSTETEAIPPPHVEGTPKVFPVKIQKIVEDISQLTLVEVCDLNELLKQKLKIQDAPVMAMAAGAVPAQKEEEEEEAVPRREKTSFTVKLTKFDDTKKIALIKELKNLLPNINLVQAKKIVDSLPQVVKADIAKDEAEKLKTALEASGGVADIE